MTRVEFVSVMKAIISIHKVETATHSGESFEDAKERIEKVIHPGKISPFLPSTLFAAVENYTTQATQSFPLGDELHSSTESCAEEGSL